MWITSKAFVEEIKKEHAALGDKMEETAAAQMEFSTEIIKQICELNKRLEQLEKISLHEKEKNDTNYADLAGSLNRLDKTIEEFEKNTIQALKKDNDEMSKGFDSMKSAMKDVVNSVECQEKTQIENMKSMNISMQEIIRNLLSLDEGNRLIIAKLLLQEMNL